MPAQARVRFVAAASMRLGVHELSCRTPVSVAFAEARPLSDEAFELSPR